MTRVSRRLGRELSRGMGTSLMRQGALVRAMTKLSNTRLSDDVQWGAGLKVGGRRVASRSCMRFVARRFPLNRPETYGSMRKIDWSPMLRRFIVACAILFCSRGEAVANAPLSLNLAVADYPHTRAILSGRIPIE